MDFEIKDGVAIIPEGTTEIGMEFKVGDYSFEIISQEEKTCRAIRYYSPEFFYKSNSFEAETVCEIP